MRWIYILNCCQQPSVASKPKLRQSQVLHQHFLPILMAQKTHVACTNILVWICQMEIDLTSCFQNQLDFWNKARKDVQIKPSGCMLFHLLWGHALCQKQRVLSDKKSFQNQPNLDIWALSGVCNSSLALSFSPFAITSPCPLCHRNHVVTHSSGSPDFTCSGVQKESVRLENQFSVEQNEHLGFCSFCSLKDEHCWGKLQLAATQHCFEETSKDTWHGTTTPSSWLHFPFWSSFMGARGSKRWRKIQCSGDFSFLARFPALWKNAKRNAKFEENWRKRKN